MPYEDALKLTEAMFAIPVWLPFAICTVLGGWWGKVSFLVNLLFAVSTVTIMFLVGRENIWFAFAVGVDGLKLLASAVAGTLFGIAFATGFQILWRQVSRR